MSEKENIPMTEVAETPAPTEPEVYETSDDILREGGNDRPVKPRVPREPIRVGELLRPMLSLFAICAVVALVVSFVYAMTADTIAAAEAAEREAAIADIFGASEITALEPLPGTKAVYAVADRGYCVNLDARGFGGKIDMMVGLDDTGAIVGVEIVNHSETPGFGDRAAEPDYLAQYAGMGVALTLGKEVDAVSGATITSRGVIAAVNAATAALVEAGLVPEYHAPEPPRELTEEEQLEAELAALYAEMGIETDEYGAPIYDEYDGGEEG